MPTELSGWHPAAVHFPVALGLTAALMLTWAAVGRAPAWLGAAARLQLQLAAVAALVSAALGALAFASVEHDAAGHAVMLRHRAWALCSLAGLLAVAGWESWRQWRGWAVHKLSWLPALAVAGSLAQTGALGGEMVYRHGVGVDAAAFAEPPAPAAAATEPPVPVAASEAAESAPHEHVHRDGRRHRH